MKMIILLNRYPGIPFESLIPGNKDVELNPEMKKQLLKVPAVSDYLKKRGKRKGYIRSFKRAARDADILTIAEEGMDDYSPGFVIRTKEIMTITLASGRYPG